MYCNRWRGLPGKTDSNLYRWQNPNHGRLWTNRNSPVMCVNRFDVKHRKFGTVGPVIDGVEVKIAEDGEILCKGPNVMMGYYKRPDLTEEVIKDGWLHTGDIGTMVDDKFLRSPIVKKNYLKPVVENM